MTTAERRAINLTRLIKDYLKLDNAQRLAVLEACPSLYLSLTDLVRDEEGMTSA